MPSEPPPPDPKRAVIDDHVERAVAPYLGKLPPEMIDKLRALAREALETHPFGSALVGRLAARPIVQSSGVVVGPGGVEDDEANAGGKSS